VANCCTVRRFSWIVSADLLELGCDIELPAYLGVGVEAHTAVKIPDQPFAQIHYLCTASPLMSKLELPIVASLE